MNSIEFKSASPILQAAYAHYAFVCVHPFADGNGRVARALASVFLYREPGIPLVIFADQRDPYLDSLESADAGIPEAFILFVSERAIDTIELIRLHIQRPAVVAIRDQALEQLRAALIARGGLSHMEIDQIAHRILDAFREEASVQIASLDLPTGFTIDISQGHGVTNSSIAPQGFREIQSNNRYLVFVAKSSPPGEAELNYNYRIFAASPGTRGPDFIILREGSEEWLGLQLRDAYPAMSAVAHLKLEPWIERQLAMILDAVLAAVRQRLIQTGYLPQE